MDKYKTHPKFNKPMRTYWDSFEGSYQMGEQKHRLYMLDLLRLKGVETLLDVGMGTAPIFDLIVNSKEETRVARKYVCIILWRGFVNEGTNLNSRNEMGLTDENGKLLPGKEPWEDTFLQEYSREVLEEEFKKNNLTIDHIAEGEEINSDTSKYNFLYLLRKGEI